jgi:hypothetical protein
MNHPRLPTFNYGWCVLTVAAAGILFSQLPATAQESSPGPDRNQTDADNTKFTVRSNLVFLPARVQTKSGETIYGIKPEQFIVKDNGVRQSVHVEQDPDYSGLSLVVAVQCSGTAGSEFNKLKGLGAMIDAIAGDAAHEVSILSYGAGPYTLGGFSSSSEAVRLALSRLKPCDIETWDRRKPARRWRSSVIAAATWVGPRMPCPSGCL